jgi:hypothetical protein
MAAPTQQELMAQLAEAKTRIAALEAALAAKEQHEDSVDGDDEEDDQWECCSCATPEMCDGDCKTREFFSDWREEEKTKGVEHHLPVRDFKKALKSGWGLEHRIKKAEEQWGIARRQYQRALLEELDEANNSEQLIAFSDEEDFWTNEVNRLWELRDERAAAAAGAGV